MKNKKGTIILSIILAVQFIIPLSIWGYETYKNKELEEKGQEIKLLVSYVNYHNHQIEFTGSEICGNMSGFGGEDYLVFEAGDDGFYTCKESETKEGTDLYVNRDRMYSWYKEDWCLKYKSELTKAQEEYDYYDLYNKPNEKENIIKGYCEGPETQAYAVFKIYKNRFKVVNVYIDEMPVDTIIQKYINNEWDASRYEEVYYDDIYYDGEIEDYYREYYDEELNEYVTEPVTA